MPVVKVKGTDQQIQFPDDMSPEQILDVMRNQYRPPDYGSALRNNAYAAPYNPSLTERIGSGIGNALHDTGIISDRYGANRIGENVTNMLGVLPGLGDAMGGDDFGRALRQGDAMGIGMGALSAVPVVGDIAKQLPSKGKVITDFYELFDYTPEQLAMQAKYSDPDNVIDGVYTIDRGKFRTEYYDDGTSAIVMNEDGRKLKEFTQDETKDALKGKILDAEAKRPEALEIEARKQQAREQAQAAQVENESYKMQHTAPILEDGNSSGADVSDMFGEDIYSSKAVDYFGHGVPYDRKAINIIRQMRNNPEKPVTIYRAVPKDVKDINAGDWVTTTREYAKDHMAGETGWHILSKKVKAGEIATDGNSIHEWGYSPTSGQGR